MCNPRPILFFVSGANVHMEDKFGATALALAGETENTEVAEILKAAGDCSTSSKNKIRYYVKGHRTLIVVIELFLFRIDRNAPFCAFKVPITEVNLYEQYYRDGYPDFSLVLGTTSVEARLKTEEKLNCCPFYHNFR